MLEGMTDLNGVLWLGVSVESFFKVLLILLPRWEADLVEAGNNFV